MKKGIMKLIEKSSTLSILTLVIMTPWEEVKEYERELERQ